LLETQCKVCGQSKKSHEEAHDHFFAKNFDSRARRLYYIHQHWPGICQKFIDPDDDIAIEEAKKKGSVPYPQE